MLKNCMPAGNFLVINYTSKKDTFIDLLNVICEVCIESINNQEYFIDVTIMILSGKNEENKRELTKGLLCCQANIGRRKGS